MAKQGGLGERLWIHGRDVSGDVGRLNNLSAPRGSLEVPGLSAVAMERLLLLGDGALDFNGWFNDATDQLHDALKSLPTTDVLAMLAQSTTRGAPMAALLAKMVNVTLDRTQDGALAVQAQLLANAAALEWGVMITAGAETLSSSGSLSSLDENGATGSSSAGAIAYVSYESLASGSPTLLVEDSPDDSVWATLLTFALGTAPLGERKTVTGNVDRYLRSTGTGTFSNLVHAIGVRRGTAQDDLDLS